MLKNDILYLPVSLGEAIDKLTILDIKAEKISDIRNGSNLKINHGGGGIICTKQQCDATYIGSLALVTHIFNNNINSLAISSSPSTLNNINFPLVPSLI
jgi:hypothetical protein